MQSIALSTLSAGTCKPYTKMIIISSDVHLLEQIICSFLYIIEFLCIIHGSRRSVRRGRSGPDPLQKPGRRRAPLQPQDLLYKDCISQPNKASRSNHWTLRHTKSIRSSLLRFAVNPVRARVENRLDVLLWRRSANPAGSMARLRCGRPSQRAG